MELRSGILLAILVLSACAGDAGESDLTVLETDAGREGCADVVDVAVRAVGDRFAFDVSVMSADTGWDKYADAWELRGPDGEVLGTRELLHPHETEQPFTRSLTGIEVPGSVSVVTVAARDSVLGFCGKTMSVTVPGRS